MLKNVSIFLFIRLAALLDQYCKDIFTNSLYAGLRIPVIISCQFSFMKDSLCFQSLFLCLYFYIKFYVDKVLDKTDILMFVGKWYMNIIFQWNIKRKYAWFYILCLVSLSEEMLKRTTFLKYFDCYWSFLVRFASDWINKIYK
jgi:hypothetical protein